MGILNALYKGIKPQTNKTVRLSQKQGQMRRENRVLGMFYKKWQGRYGVNMAHFVKFWGHEGGVRVKGV